jgi:hypothetical protein
MRMMLRMLWCLHAMTCDERKFGCWVQLGTNSRTPPQSLGCGEGHGFQLAELPVLKSYLVDPASSHMLVSKIKPCMSKYKLFYTVKLRMAH